MTRRSRQGGAKGYGRALDAEVRQGKAHGRRQARDRHRHPELRLQEMVYRGGCHLKQMKLQPLHIRWLDRGRV